MSSYPHISRLRASQAKTAAIPAYASLFGAVLLLTWLFVMALSLPAHAQDNELPPLPETSAPADLPPPPNSALPPGVEPSDDMDFNLPALPSVTNEALEKFTPERLLQETDRFFSSAPIMPGDEPEPPVDEASDNPLPSTQKSVENDQKPIKKIEKKPDTPPYSFKSVRLPPELYRKHYSDENRHLPVAVFERDLNQAVVDAAAAADINSLLAFAGQPRLSGHGVSGETPLIAAVRHGNREIVLWLLRQKVAADDTDAYGLSALHYAAFSGDAPILRALLSFKADPNQSDANGNTPLMMAARSGGENAVAVLLQYGANISARSVSGETALRMATLSGNRSVEDQLLAAGAPAQALR